MSLITTLARMEAVREGRAQPLTTVRHRHLSERPLAFVPLTTAGEAGAPLGAMVGTDRDAPRLLIVAQPRDRDLRFVFLAELAEEIQPYLDSYADGIELEERKETDPETGKKVPVQVELCEDAPQLLVPSAAGVAFVRLLGRSMRFRRTAEQDPETPFPAPARVPLLGRWLTHYGERSRVPGSCLLLSLTELLSRHWATGQSNLEDQHLGSLLAWIDPPEGMPGAEAALRAESERDADGRLRCPPAGPATDPAFDNKLLAPAMSRYDAARAEASQGVAGGEARLRLAEAALRGLMESQLRPTWDALWRGVDLLRSLPEGARVADRWKRDRWSYTGHRDRVRAGEPPQPKRDDAVTAAQKLAARETAQAQLDAHEALDDPLVMAGRRLAGEAFAGEVIDVEMAWSDAKVPRPRPLVTVRTEDRPHLAERVKLHRVVADGKAQSGEFAGFADVDGADGADETVETGGADGAEGRGDAGGPGSEHGTGDEHGTGGAARALVVRLTGGMGRGKQPEPGTVPEKGDRVCWTLFEHAPRGGPELPDPESTPWTHGGPPDAAAPAQGPEPEPMTEEDYL